MADVEPDSWEPRWRRWSVALPRVVALADSQRRLTYSELPPAVDSLATLLRAAGVVRHARVLVVSENNVATIVVTYALRQLGAWPALFNARAGSAELEALVDLAQPSHLVYAPGLAPAVPPLMASQRTQSCADERWGPLEVASRMAQPIAQSGDTPIGLLLFTSGTTGLPKAVMWSEAALLQMGETLTQTRHTTTGDTVQAAGPVSHIMGVANWMTALAAGATLQLMPRLDVDELGRALAAGQVSHLSLVPTAYRRLCDLLERQPGWAVHANLRYISSGGAMLDASLKSRVEQLLGRRLVNGYGMTECAPGSRTRPDLDAPAGCIGWPEPGTELRLEQPVGGIGELWMRSRSMMLGYLAQPEETAGALRPGGWLATGDLARQHADGSFEVVGRKKEMIIRSGFNVYPAEIEAALNALPEVRLSAVVGRQGGDGEERIEAYVQLRGQAVDGDSELEAMLMAQLRRRLAPYKLPQAIHMRAELPLSANGKVRKHLLR